MHAAFVAWMSTRRAQAPQRRRGDLNSCVGRSGDPSPPAADRLFRHRVPSSPSATCETSLRTVRCPLSPCSTRWQGATDSDRLRRPRARARATRLRRDGARAPRPRYGSHRRQASQGATPSASKARPLTGCQAPSRAVSGQLVLASLAASNANLFGLVEATTNRDPSSVKALGVMRSWNGTIIAVSHERGFVESLGPTNALLAEKSSICGAITTLAYSCVAEAWRRSVSPPRVRPLMRPEQRACH